MGMIFKRFILINFFSVWIIGACKLSIDPSEIRQLAKQWAPLIWFDTNEKYFPTSVEKFLENVHLEDEYGLPPSPKTSNFQLFDSSSFYFVTTEELEKLKKKNDSFLFGDRPSTMPPIYVLVKICSQPKMTIQITYWTFYPYNKGKSMCVFGKFPSIRLFGKCFLGKQKTIGSHIGDWEHVSLLFHTPYYPTEMFLSVHDTGVYYSYDPFRRKFFFKSIKFKKKFQFQKPVYAKYVDIQYDSGHPVLFAAEGSHGLWGKAGANQYVWTPRLIDNCSFGEPWKTWKNLQIFIIGVDKLPQWFTFQGKWGNPALNCTFPKKLGWCEYHDGPAGILSHEDDFPCLL